MNKKCIIRIGCHIKEIEEESTKCYYVKDRKVRPNQAAKFRLLTSDFPFGFSRNKDLKFCTKGYHIMYIGGDAKVFPMYEYEDRDKYWVLS